MVRGVRIPAVHQPGDVFEADVAGLQFLVVEDAYAAVPDDLVPVEGEVHLLDAVTLGAGAELGLGARGAATEEDAVG